MADVTPTPGSRIADSKQPSKSTAVIEPPPEEEFWDRYNKRLEFPLSSVAAVLLHVGVAALLVFALVRLMDKDEDKSGVPVKLVNLAGLDDEGEGSSGSGGIDDPIVRTDNDPVRSAIDSLPDPSKLPEIKENLRQSIKYLDPTGNMPISDANAAAYQGLEESLRKKLLGARQGSGNEKGSGYDGSAGKGPGGTGADSTLGRNMRWVLRFKVNGGRDYLDQLHAMGAKLLIPIPPENSKCIMIEDIRNPGNQRVATDGDLSAMAAQVKFSDTRPGVVREVAAALGLDFTPKTFWAFFPKNVEEELARKETQHRNRRADDIEETIFRVAVRGGAFEILVDEQKLKR